jgi:hypothetical protein
VGGHCGLEKDFTSWRSESENLAYLLGKLIKCKSERKPAEERKPAFSISTAELEAGTKFIMQMKLEEYQDAL